MLKCLRKILEMRGSAGLYVTTKGTTTYVVGIKKVGQQNMLIIRDDS